MAPRAARLRTYRKLRPPHECRSLVLTSPQCAPRDHRAHRAGKTRVRYREVLAFFRWTRDEIEPLNRHRAPFWSTLPPRLQMASFKGRLPPPRFTGRVLATGNEGIHRAHSGNPAFRRPSIKTFEFDWPPRAIIADIVRPGSTSSRRAAASRACPSRPRWANADARQR